MECKIKCSACDGAGMLYTSTFFSVLHPAGAKQCWHYKCTCCGGTGFVSEDKRLHELAEVNYEQDLGLGLMVTYLVARA